MKILVPVKRVPDYQEKIKIKPDGSGIITENIKYIINPFDEIAIEEAVRLKEQGLAETVTIVSIGVENVKTQLQYGLALGADNALLVQYEGYLDSSTTAHCLKAIWEKDKYDLLLIGKQAIDSDSNETAQRLATLLKLPQACFASEIKKDGSVFRVTREIDGGLQSIELTLPCLISTDLRLNEPRYPSLPNLMKAKKKPLETISINELNVDLATKVKIVKMEQPPQKKSGKIVADVSELVALLQSEARVLS
jgi:electron transfer flavoprotein beta subunit